jgi:hypothetical protein
MAVVKQRWPELIIGVGCLAMLIGIAVHLGSAGRFVVVCSVLVVVIIGMLALRSVFDTDSPSRLVETSATLDDRLAQLTQSLKSLELQRNATPAELKQAALETAGLALVTHDAFSTEARLDDADMWKRLETACSAFLSFSSGIPQSPKFAQLDDDPDFAQAKASIQNVLAYIQKEHPRLKRQNEELEDAYEWVRAA